MRSFVALLINSKKALVVLSAAVALALVGTGIGYAAMSKTVTLSVDGHPTQVSTLGTTVADVLNSKDIKIGNHDVVAPGLNSSIHDGSQVAVKFGRPLDVSIDGNNHHYWVTATDVATALEQVGVRVGGATLSASRDASVPRRGMDLRIVTPKTLTVKLAGAKPRKRTVAAVTTAEALKKLGVKFGKGDQVRPGLGHTLKNGDTLVYTDVRQVTRKVTEQVGYHTIKHSDSSMYTDQTRLLRAGKPGSRRVVYRITYVNGNVHKRQPLKITLLSKPQAAIEKVGTKSRMPSYAGGTGVWDRIAACESGGNWAENTGNGYYGGLQFDMSTWQSYGGTGRPDQASKAQQIAIAVKVRNANGGYSAWPVCGKQA